MIAFILKRNSSKARLVFQTCMKKAFCDETQLSWRTIALQQNLYPLEKTLHKKHYFWLVKKENKSQLVQRLCNGIWFS